MSKSLLPSVYYKIESEYVMEQIGTVKLVQIQQKALKIQRDDGKRDYDPAAIVPLARIQLTSAGIVGLADADDRIMDVHHIRHPRSRYRGDNSISMGFTSHYEKMRAEIGHHIKDGSGGENIIVNSNHIIAPHDLGRRAAIKSSVDGSMIILQAVMPIPPCEPFSQFLCAKVLSPPETKSILRFLSGGMRGYYMTLETAAPRIIIQTGDIVYRVADEIPHITP